MTAEGIHNIPGTVSHEKVHVNTDKNSFYLKNYAQYINFILTIFLL